MKRLTKENKNTPGSYIQKEPDWFDKKRLKLLVEYYNGGKLLDLGSYGKHLRNEAYELGLGNYEFEAINWMPEKLEYKNNTYDYVVMGQLLEHLDDPAKYLKEAMRVLKVGGVLALSVPLNETEAGEVDKEHHLWSFSENDIIEMLKPYGAYEIEILRSEHIPKYRYHFPYLLAWCKKND